MKKTPASLSLLLAALLRLPAGGGTDTAADTPSPTPENTAQTTPENTPGSQVADSSQMTTVEDVVEEGMVPIYADDLKDGVYDVTVDSSSSMFSIVQCELTVENGAMTAVMHMGGTGYLKVFMGTGEEAVAAGEEDYIPYEEQADGTHTFTRCV